MKHFQQVFDANEIPVARSDGAGYFIEVNKAYEQLTGYTLEELLTKTYHDITPDKWLVFENHKVIQDVFKHGEIKYQKEYIHKSGKIISINAHVYLHQSDEHNEKGMWGTFEEIK